MTTFVDFMFWYFVATVVLRAVIVAFSKYPRTPVINVGADIVALIIGIAIAVWAGVIRS